VELPASYTTPSPVEFCFNFVLPDGRVDLRVGSHDKGPLSGLLRDSTAFGQAFWRYLAGKLRLAAKEGLVCNALNAASILTK
jgi:hypothetical protein